MSRLTFERIRKKCEPMRHLLVDEDGDEWLYLGFNREKFLVLDFNAGCGSTSLSESAIKKMGNKRIQADSES